MPIKCVHKCDLLGITLSNSRTTANVIEKAVMKFNMKSNEKSRISNCCHVILNQNYLQLFVLMFTDVSYGILNQEKCTIFMSLGEK